MHRPGEEESGTLQLDGHVGQLPSEALQVADGPAVDFAVVHVPHRVLQCTLCRAHAHGGVAAPLVVEVAEQHLEGLGGVRHPGHQDVLLTDGDTVERHLGLRRRMDAHAVVAAGDGHPVPVHGDDHRADALCALAAGPATPDQNALGHIAERGVVLVPIEPEPARAVGRQGTAHVLDSRSGVGLGDTDAHDGLAVGHQWQPPLLQRVAAKMLDTPGRSVECELAADRRGHVVAGDLLQHDGRLDVTQAQTTPLLPDGHPEQVGLGQCRDGVGREHPGHVRVTGQRCHRPVAHVAGQPA